MIRKNRPTILLLLTAVIIISLASCDPSKKYEKRESQEIQEYLTNNFNLNFELKTSGLYYLETEAGTGLSPALYDSAYVIYTAMFLDGTVFDTNEGTGTLYGFIVGENIAGFDEGVMLMKEGGKSTLLVPSKLAYGTYGRYPYIQGYTPLLFELELVSVIPASGK
jgi:FKBP-type peptidyl-prolyl cis-trans isomerase FkpA